MISSNSDATSSVLKCVTVPHHADNNGVHICTDVVPQAIEASYLAETLSSPDEITETLDPIWKPLGNASQTANPRFFLASMSHLWKPHVVIVKHNQETVGVVYAKERKLFGIPTGLIFLDCALATSVLAAERHFGAVLFAALNQLFHRPGVIGIRVLVPAGSFSLQPKQSTRAAEIQRSPLTWHQILPLTTTYAGFLQSLGLKTRRHLRYYRRRFEEDEHEFVERISVDEFSTAASCLARQDVVGANLTKVNTASKMLGHLHEPLLAGLRSRDGEWLSVLGGWYEGRSAHIFLQINSDKRHSRYSLSCVLRSYVIESLIRRGFTEAIFCDGLEGRLRRHTKPIASDCIYWDRTNMWWRVLRRTLWLGKAAFPRHKAHLPQWIVPPGDRV